MATDPRDTEIARLRSIVSEWGKMLLTDHRLTVNDVRRALGLQEEATT